MVNKRPLVTIFVTRNLFGCERYRTIETMPAGATNARRRIGAVDTRSHTVRSVDSTFGLETADGCALST